MSNIFVKGNSKLGPEVLIFNLPPVETCNPSKWCLANCYAQKGNHLFPTVAESHQRRLNLSKQDNFVEGATRELQKSPLKFVRVHAAGDFYSAEYIHKWARIAIENPTKIFKTTTHRRDLKEALRSFANLPNVIIRESLDPSRRIPSGNFATYMFIEGPNYPIEGPVFRCVEHCPTCGYVCWVRPDLSISLGVI